MDARFPAPIAASWLVIGLAVAALAAMPARTAAQPTAPAAADTKKAEKGEKSEKGGKDAAKAGGKGEGKGEGKAAADAAPPAAPAEAPPAKVDLNTATEQQLVQVLGIDAARARSIVRNRPYDSADQLVQRMVMSQKDFNQIKGKLAVGR